MSSPLGTMSTSVSIIIPSYNAEPTSLCRAVRSALAQTYPVVDVLISDDGSSIPVEAVLKPLLPNLGDDQRRISIIQSKCNEGISSARNRAAFVSSSDWLMWLDADDTLDAECVERLIAESQDMDLVVGECLVIEGSNTARRRPRSYFEEAKRLLRTPRDPFLLNVISIQPQIFRRSVFESIGGFNQDYRLAEMTELFLRYVARHGLSRVNFIDDAIYCYYRDRPDSVSSDRLRLMEYRKRCLKTYMHEIGIAGRDLIYVGRNTRSGMQEYKLSP